MMISILSLSCFNRIGRDLIYALYLFLSLSLIQTADDVAPAVLRGPATADVRPAQPVPGTVLPGIRLRRPAPALLL